MGKNWMFFVEPDGVNGSYPMDPIVPHVSGHWLFHVSSFVDNSKYFYVPGSLALQEACNCLSKCTSALLLWFASGSNSHINNNISGDHIGSSSSCKASVQVKRVHSNKYDFSGFFWKSRYKGKSAVPAVLGKISRFTLKQLFKEAERLQSLPALSLAAALVPPFTDVFSQRCMDGRPCEVETRGCGPFSEIYLQNLAWSSNAVEPRTGIEFPTVLDNIITGENTSLTPEVLVGIGSRTMTIIRIKSLKLYAFGFYVHPFDVCEKLGPKYACIPEYELNKRQDFYQDLLREDINMTVRLVISCNGIRISTVRDAFEKSLRARLIRTNPDADHHCLHTFSSIFSQDIPLHVGTTINFHRTADGKLITEVGGNQLGAVQSKDLCRAFFDMYIGDVPVCEQTKEEIGKNVASIIRTC
ncbi:fatty-acid-binding protein 2-like isoform X1 [Olea europaea var. sylvestris]|uniref:fatty-acid-binding protein 2-like isoform X1 n=1 Tax=Olea europaea var. sylvestris TaxID=158386 RepID=UPI000C1D669B|nr:fatty-acid-binding protein 2-like isoform X1 [Olea europaea var. sylvestris]